MIPLIKYDMDWVHTNWTSDGCDLWEEVHSNDFFWNRMSYYYAMDIGAKLLEKLVIAPMLQSVIPLKLQFKQL